ncbi:DUF2336 domain-containing protein [Bradyrhizobium sp.]|uniref:DUF2336 domain-containing protein n=1 Tax=Bradyrhizobium sp. TaxID=376 RepID=UPI003BAFD387
MTEAKTVLQEIDEAILQGSPESRARALWHATDILIAGRYTEDQIWVFGEVIGRLADEIEGAARAKLARQLAHSSNAPFNVILVLASDDLIDVAGPVLQHSERLDDKMLVASTRTKSQAHLLAISKRRSIPVVVTDELVSRGNREVVHSIAVNTGARFSDFGFLQMIKRSEGDSVLAEHIGLRKEIPRHMFQQLIAKASDDVKRKLEQERPDLVDEIQNSVTEVTGALQSKFGPASKSYFNAKRVVTAQHQYGNLNENSILGYARAHNFEETTVGLSLLCSMPVDVVERALVHNSEMTLILAKALGFGWETAMSLLFLGAKDHRISAHDLDGKKEEFARLNQETSRSVLKLYQSRKSAAGADSDQRRLPQLHAAG